MYFYEVWVASNLASKPLSYHADDKLSVGQIVRVPFGVKQASGIIVRFTNKPAVKTKEITKNTDKKLPEKLVKLMVWLGRYYPAPTGRIAALFLAKYDGSNNDIVDIQPSLATPKVQLPSLTADQEKAVKKITSTEQTSFLLHGVTGSGKTRIYVELIKQAIESGTSVLLLCPEIGLTSQLYQTLYQSLSNVPIRVIHSGMTALERERVWTAIQQEIGSQVVIGARSALFSPIPKLGYVIVDEAHDNAYKNNSQPYYQTTRVAAQLSRLHGAKLILGTATPLINDYYIFTSQALPIIELKQTALPTPKAQKQITVVDIRNRSAFGRSTWLSEALLKETSNALEQSRQSLVLLNRRGSARLTMCSQCGWQAICPHCDVPLTFHSDDYHLVCHVCGITQKVPSACPVCNKADIRFRQPGTKLVTEELQRLFPNARIQRFDSDSKKADSLPRQYTDVASGNIQILVGTQILTKGWDLPHLGFVGIVSADSSLSFPDYTAEENTFLLLHQVLGRIHRGHIPGRAVIQTYHPDSKVIASAIDGQYKTFYKEQLIERKAFHYPPYIFVMKLWIRRKSKASAYSAGQKLAGILQEKNHQVEILGPSPAYQEKQRGMYQWQLILKAKNRSDLLSVISDIPGGWSYDIDPVHLL